MDYVILAGGLGSRLLKEGLSVPKPMAPLMGEPMIGRLVRILTSFGAEKIQISANGRMPMLIEYLEGLREKGYPVVVRPIITDNSYCSLKEAARGLEGKFIGMTCDAIFTNREFEDYIREFEGVTNETVLMGLTKFVDDESPLYARIAPDGEIIDYRYGGEPFAEGTVVSAGIYGLSRRAMDYIIETDKHPSSLSDFQRILAAESPLTVEPFYFEKAFDVDNLHDREAAETFLRENNS